MGRIVRVGAVLAFGLVLALASGCGMSSVKTEDLKEGTGAEAKKGDRVTVHYTGWLANGIKFDSSLDREQPFTFRLGYDNVIQGWHDGVQGMKVGGKRKLVIPPSLAYGSAGKPPAIPANAQLTFEVELLDMY